MPNVDSSPVFAVAVLGAGASVRMGRSKLLLPWGDTTILGDLVARWRQLGIAQIAVVTAPDDAPLQSELDRLGVPPADRLINPQPERGMFSSVRGAAAWSGWTPAATHWVLTLGDQPLVRTETLRALLDLAARHPAKICQPSRAGRPRHPIVFPRGFLASLAVAPQAHLKEYLAQRADGRAQWESTDPGLDLDLDRPEDYEHALRLRVSPEEGREIRAPDRAARER